MEFSEFSWRDPALVEAMEFPWRDPALIEAMKTRDDTSAVCLLLRMCVLNHKKAHYCPSVMRREEESQAEIAGDSTALGI